MMSARTVPANEFARNFGRYQDEAISAGIINVTSHGRVVGAYLSAAELEHFECLKRRECEVLKIGKFDDDTLAAIEAAEYGVVRTKGAGTDRNRFCDPNPHPITPKNPGSGIRARLAWHIMP